MRDPLHHSDVVELPTEDVADAATERGRQDQDQGHGAEVAVGDAHGDRPGVLDRSIHMPINRTTHRPSATAESTAQNAVTATTSASDWGLLLIRLSFGLLMAGHGSQKLFGIFGGQGLTETGKGFAALGYQPGKLFALIGGLSEFLGGLGLAFGLLTPLAAAALIGVMINAMATVTGAHGLWETDGGVEYNVCIAVVALAVAAIGPGRLAVDRFFRWGTGGWPEAAVALGLGGIAAAISLSL